MTIERDARSAGRSAPLTTVAAVPAVVASTEYALCSRRGRVQTKRLPRERLELDFDK